MGIHAKLVLILCHEFVAHLNSAGKEPEWNM